MGYRGIGGLAGISSTPFRGTDRENSGECPRERTSEGVECAPARPTTSTTRTSGTHRASFIPPKSAPGQPDSSTSRRARRRSLPPLATPPEAPNDYLIDPSQFAGRDAGKGLAKLPEPESYSDRAKDPSTMAMAFINACLSGPARDWMEKTWPLERIARHLEKGFVSQTSHRDAETERHRISSRGRTDTEGPSVN